MEKWIRQHANEYLRHGGKISRRNNVKRLIAISRDIAANEHGVLLPTQIGKAHIRRYYIRNAELSHRTLADHYYTIRLLWTLLNRPKLPPKPPIRLD